MVSRPCVIPSVFPAAYPAIGGVRGRQFNPIAVARINAIYAAGGSCPVGQATAISLLSDFINAEQSSGRWANHRRIYIPGFGNAGANAIDIVGGTSGSFPVDGGVTHGAGFAQGNGTTGYFDMLASPSSLGMTTTQGGLVALITQADSRTDFRCIMGVSTGSGTQETYLAHDSSTALRFSYTVFPLSLAATLARASQTGILSAGRTGTEMRIRRRTTSGVTMVGSSSNTNTGGISTTNMNLFRLAGANGFFSNCRIGAASVDLGLSVSDRDAYTANLRTLWEGLFQQTIPS